VTGVKDTINKLARQPSDATNLMDGRSVKGCKSTVENRESVGHAINKEVKDAG
jgi:hypothetical protein